MVLSKEQKVAKTLNTLSDLDLCNFKSAASEKDWTEFVNDYFGTDGDQAESSSEDEDSDEEGLVAPGKGTVVNENGLCGVHLPVGVNINQVSDDDVGILPKPPVVVDEVQEVLAKSETSPTSIADDKETELKKIRDYTCKGCKVNNGSSCISFFDEEFVYDLRLAMSSLVDFEKDLILLGKISCGFRNDPLTRSSKKKEQHARQHQRTEHYVNGNRVCRETFKFLHCISQNKLTALLKHYKEFGLTPRTKKSGGRRAGEKCLMSHEDITRVVTFIVNFAESNALVLPGRVPGFKRFDIKLIPSHYTKAKVYCMYKSAIKEAGERVLSLVSFRRLWRTLVPFIVRTKPMTDLCCFCQKNNYAIFKSANIPDSEKSELVKTQKAHLLNVTKERSLYNDMIQKSKEVVKALQLKDLVPCEPSSRDVEMHYSFGYAQQVHYPSDPAQPGPMYFLTPRKCGLFGINCEAFPKQVNYLIDEGMCITNGANAVISYLDHFFANYGIGEWDVHLHCDNCLGQNKNNIVLQYLLWRTLHGYHVSISLNFMITGHTKFAPDWASGLLKQCYRRTRVSCLEDIAGVVSSSTNIGVNIPQLVGRENGEVLVEQRDWQSFLKPYFHTLPGIKKQQHFRMTSENPGWVFKREMANSAEDSVFLLKAAHEIPPAQRPAVIDPPGLDRKRQDYLFKNIREFCTPESMDITCPEPNRDAKVENAPSDSESDNEQPVVQRPKKRSRFTK